MKTFKYKDYNMKVEYCKIWNEYEITITNENTTIIYNVDNYNIAQRGGGMINGKNITSDGFTSWKGSGKRLSEKEKNELKNIDEALPYFIK